MERDLIAVSDYNRLAVLDLYRIAPIRVEYRDQRYWAYFDRMAVKSVLAQYESGGLSAPLRDFVASLSRVKTRIFESERFARTGADNEIERSSR